MTIASHQQDTSSAGWYPDPALSQLLRYWDGRAWTEHLEHPGPAAEPQYAFATDGSIIRVHQYA